MLKQRSDVDGVISEIQCLYLPFRQKGRLCCACVRCVMLYENGTWTVKEEDLSD